MAAEHGTPSIGKAEPSDVSSRRGGAPKDVGAAVTRRPGRQGGRDGDNVVTTLMEHNSNYVPWYGMCREILPRLGRRVDYWMWTTWRSPSTSCWRRSGWGCC